MVKCVHRLWALERKSTEAFLDSCTVWICVD